MNYLTARIDKLEKEYNLLEKDNNRLAARNQNYLEMLKIAKDKYGDGAFVDPDAELRREVFQKGMPASIPPFDLIYTNINIAEKELGFQITHFMLRQINIPSKPMYMAPNW